MDWLRDFSFRENEGVLAAVSGGADSVALLLALREAARHGRVRLWCAHFDHGIRGEDSRRDASFVEELCARLGVECVVGRADVPGIAKARGIGLELAAREARYAFLREAKARFGADVIALAHHMDDQAETVLMHAARGCALRGLGGMSEREGDLIRPLLRARKAEFIAYLREIGQEWREDATNLTPDNPRNAVRLRVLPPLETVYPGAARALCRLARLAREEDALLERLARSEAEAGATSFFGGWRFERTAFSDAALLRRALALAKPMPFDALERAMTLPDGGACDLPGGLRARAKGTRLYLLDAPCAPPEPVPFLGAGRYELPGVCALTAEPCAAEPVRDDPWRQALSAKALVGCELRARRPGDRVRPLGAPGAKSLNDYLTDKKLDAPMRDAQPILARGRDVLWAPGVGIAETAKLDGGEALMLTCRPIYGKL